MPRGHQRPAEAQPWAGCRPGRQPAGNWQPGPAPACASGRCHPGGDPAEARGVRGCGGEFVSSPKSKGHCAAGSRNTKLLSVVRGETPFVWTPGPSQTDPCSGRAGGVLLCDGGTVCGSQDHPVRGPRGTNHQVLSAHGRARAFQMVSAKTRPGRARGETCRRLHRQQSKTASPGPGTRGARSAGGRRGAPCPRAGGRQPSLRPARLQRLPSSLSPPHTPAGRVQPRGLTLPTRLMAQVKQWLAMAAFLASIGHMDSL